MPDPVCVIIGAGPGNGAAFARRLAREGFGTALIARSRTTLDPLEAEIPGSRGYACDATDEDAVADTFEQIRAQLGAPTVLIYNASGRDFADIDGTTPEAFEHAWRVSAYGCLLAAKTMLPDLRARGSGSIVVIGATASLKAGADFLAFASAKAALRSLAQSLARKLDPEGIHVAHVVLDAMVDMPSARRMMPDAPDDFFARPDDIAESVWFLTRQPRSAWTFELDLRPFGERW